MEGKELERMNVSNTVMTGIWERGQVCFLQLTSSRGTTRIQGENSREKDID